MEIGNGGMERKEVIKRRKLGHEGRKGKGI